MIQSDLANFGGVVLLVVVSLLFLSQGILILA